MPKPIDALANVADGEQEGTATLNVPTHDLKCCSLLAVPYANTACEVQVWTLDRFDRQMGCPNRILLPRHRGTTDPTPRRHRPDHRAAVN